MKSIGNYAFEYCSKLKSITIPNSVTSIGQYAFQDCPSLLNINIEIVEWENSNNIAKWYALTFHYLYNGKKLEGEIEIPNTVTKIGDYALSGCKDITSITIPNSATSIGQYAFYECSSLTSITIPNSVTSIGQYAFLGTTNLESVKVEWAKPLKVGSIFDHSGGSILSTLYVPKGKTSIYQAAAVWQDFYDIREYDDEDDETYLLTFKTEGGSFVQSIEGGKSYGISIVANAGWEIHSATFNGTDITHQLTGTRYTTPVITEDSELNVVFRQKDNRVGAVAPTDVKVRAWAGTIHVSGADERADVVVYDASGVAVKNAQGNGSISLDTEGVFIIKVDGETFKVRL